MVLANISIGLAARAGIKAGLVHGRSLPILKAMVPGGTWRITGPISWGAFEKYRSQSYPPPPSPPLSQDPGAGLKIARPKQGQMTPQVTVTMGRLGNHCLGY